MNSRRRQAIERGAGGAPLRERGYRQAARMAVRRALREDLAGYGDLTGSAFAGDGFARVVAREAGVLSGVAALEETAHQVDPALAVQVVLHDGERFAAGDVIAELRGPLAAILAAERTALNFLCRLSGVATLTATYVAETSGTSARIAATRKTTPGCARWRSTPGARGRQVAPLRPDRRRDDQGQPRRCCRRCHRRELAGPRRRGAPTHARGRGRHAGSAGRGP